MRPQILTFFILFSLHSFGQDIMIPDYHGDKESFQKVTDKSLRADLATFTIEGTTVSDSNTRLQEFPVSNFNNTFVLFRRNDTTIKITRGAFDKSKHKLQFVDKFLVKIDNKPFWGTDGEIPKETIKSVQIIFGNDSIQIPKGSYTDLFEPNFCWKDTTSKMTKCSCSVYISADKRRMYIYMYNSDGAGGYEVTWILEGKKYLRRVVDYGF